MIDDKILDLDYAEPRTIVQVQSISFSSLTKKHLHGSKYFTERNLYYISCLKNRDTHFVSVLREDTNQDFLRHCIAHVRRVHDISDDAIKNRLTFIFVPSVSESNNLSENVLRNSRLFTEIQELLLGKPNPILDFWMVKEPERLLAKELRIPYWGLPRRASSIDSKSDARRIFLKLGIRCPRGSERLRSLEEAQNLLVDLTGQTTCSSFLIKLNAEEAGNGLARVQRDSIPLPYSEFLKRIETKGDISAHEFEQSLRSQGAVVEEFLEARYKKHPSVTMEILPSGAIRSIGTHDQILNGNSYVGARFPADSLYRKELLDAGERLALHASSIGARGLLSIDFIAIRDSETERWKLYGIEINARKSATTHPNYWTKWLTKATYDRCEGVFKTDTAGEIVYRSGEFFSKPGLDEFEPIQILEAVKCAGLEYDRKKKSGVFVHMVGAVSEHAKFGATIIGQKHSDVEKYLRQLNSVVAAL